MPFVSKTVEVASTSITVAKPQIGVGAMKGLAVTGRERWPELPDVPTVAEAGVPGFASTSWQGWFMPASTPAPIVARIQGEVAKILAIPDVQARLATMAYEGVGSTPEEFAAYYQREIAKFTQVVAEANIPKQ